MGNERITINIEGEDEHVPRRMRITEMDRVATTVVSEGLSETVFLS